MLENQKCAAKQEDGTETEEGGLERPERFDERKGEREAGRQAAKLRGGNETFVLEARTAMLGLELWVCQDEVLREQR